jgi:acetyl esterase/lipase
MKPMRTATALTLTLVLVGLVVVDAPAGDIKPLTPVKTFTFKKTKQTDLAIHVHFPPDWKKEDKRPAVVFFFGSGFQFGDVSQFEKQAAYFASRGMVAARADYRVKSRHGVEPDACVEDAKSAVRWLRQNAAKLGLDANRLVACGSSSGGYLAFLLIHGDQDPLVPVHQAQLLHDALKEKGVPVQLHIVKGAGHGVGGREVNELIDRFFDANVKSPGQKKVAPAQDPKDASK